MGSPLPIGAVSTRRGQSHVIGAVLLIGLSVVALGGLTLAVGSVMDSQATNADAERVATVMDETLHGVERTGYYSRSVTVSGGTFGAESRTLRIINGTDDVVVELQVDALVYEAGDFRVEGTWGAVVRGTPGNAWLESEPPVSSSATNEVLVLGAPVLGADRNTTVTAAGTSIDFEIDVEHTEHDLDRDEWSVAIETPTAGPFERYFEGAGASTVAVEHFPGDDEQSVVASFSGERQLFVVEHDLALVID